MRKKCLDMVYRMAKADPRIVFVGSDLGHKVLDEFRAEMPDRFFMEGVSEALVVGMAAGLALEGRIPYVNTIATFLTRRAFEQTVIDVCLHNVPVRLIGNGGGLVYAPLGSTHLAFEDLSTLRPIPNLTILAPADAVQMEKLMPLTVDLPGPAYIRLGKGYDPVVTPADAELAIGRGLAYGPGGDALIVTTGVGLQPALAARELLAGDGVRAAVLHLHTVKPLDQEMLLEMMAASRAVLIMEENTLAGGLGEAVAALILENGLGGRLRFARLGLPDLFPDFYGSQKDLMARFGLTPQSAAGRIRDLLAG